VTEAVLGGELMTLLQAHKKFDHNTARFYAGCVADVLAYLHTLSIAYRDLKPENLMLDAEGYIKLVDLGFTKAIDGRSYTSCGTSEYMAPEIVRYAAHTVSVDWWCLGVLIFEMLVGRTPFVAMSPQPTAEMEATEVFRNILSYTGSVEDLGFPWFFPRDASDWISKLLVPDPRARMSPREAFEHPFLKPVDRDALRQRTLKPPLVPQLTVEDAPSAIGKDGTVPDRTLDVVEEGAAKCGHVDWSRFPGFRTTTECWATRLVED